MSTNQKARCINCGSTTVDSSYGFAGGGLGGYDKKLWVKMQQLLDTLVR